MNRRSFFLALPLLPLAVKAIAATKPPVVVPIKRVPLFDDDFAAHFGGKRWAMDMEREFLRGLKSFQPYKLEVASKPLTPILNRSTRWAFEESA